MIKVLLELFKIFFSQPSVAKSKSEVQKTKRVYITEDDIITSSGRYPERAKSPELTEEVRRNIKDIAARVNALLNELGWEEKVSISSGFRTSASNSTTKGAAKKSSHMLGKAVDIVQPKNDNKLGKLIRQTQGDEGRGGILARHGLMMEAIEITVGQQTSWVHVDTVPRAYRATYEFKP